MKIQKKIVNKCPKCLTTKHLVKNGTESERQKFICKCCETSFIQDPRTDRTSKKYLLYKKCVERTRNPLPEDLPVGLKNVSRQTLYRWRKKLGREGILLIKKKIISKNHLNLMEAFDKRIRNS
jgi:transposase-like protein